MNDSTLDYWIRTLIYDIQTAFAVVVYALRNFVRTFHVDPFIALSTVAAISLLTAAWLIPVLAARAGMQRREDERQGPHPGSRNPSASSRTPPDNTTLARKERGA